VKLKIGIFRPISRFLSKTTKYGHSYNGRRSSLVLTIILKAVLDSTEVCCRWITAWRCGRHC